MACFFLLFCLYLTTLVNAAVDDGGSHRPRSIYVTHVPSSSTKASPPTPHSFPPRGDAGGDPFDSADAVVDDSGGPIPAESQPEFAAAGDGPSKKSRLTSALRVLRSLQGAATIAVDFRVPRSVPVFGSAICASDGHVATLSARIDASLPDLVDCKSLTLRCGPARGFPKTAFSGVRIARWASDLFRRRRVLARMARDQSRAAGGRDNDDGLAAALGGIAGSLAMDGISAMARKMCARFAPGFVEFLDGRLHGRGGSGSRASQRGLGGPFRRLLSRALTDAVLSVRNVFVVAETRQFRGGTRGPAARDGGCTWWTRNTGLGVGEGTDIVAGAHVTFAPFAPNIVAKYGSNRLGARGAFVAAKVRSPPSSTDRASEATATPTLVHGTNGATGAAVSSSPSSSSSSSSSSKTAATAAVTTAIGGGEGLAESRAVVFVPERGGRGRVIVEWSEPAASCAIVDARDVWLAIAQLDVPRRGTCPITVEPQIHGVLGPPCVESSARALPPPHRGADICRVSPILHDLVSAVATMRTEKGPRGDAAPAVEIGRAADRARDRGERAVARGDAPARLFGDALITGVSPRRRAGDANRAPPCASRCRSDEALIAAQLADEAYPDVGGDAQVGRTIHVRTRRTVLPFRVTAEAKVRGHVVAIVAVSAARPAGEVWVAFRGVTDAVGWCASTDIAVARAETAPGTVRADTKALWSEIRGRIVDGILDAHARTEARGTRSAARSAGRLYSIGHSFGGTVAGLAALEFAAVHRRWSVRTLTFGAPRPGDAQFSRAWPALQRERVRAWRGRGGSRDENSAGTPPRVDVTRFVLTFSVGIGTSLSLPAQDLVTQLPPVFFGFSHPLGCTCRIPCSAADSLESATGLAMACHRSAEYAASIAEAIVN